MISLFIGDEVCLRSTTRPCSPSLAVTVSACAAERHKKKKKKKGETRPTLEGLRCGLRCQSGPRLLHPKGSYYFHRLAFHFAAALSSLINTTSHPFALIPTSRPHAGMCSTGKKKNLTRCNFFMCAVAEGQKKKFQKLLTVLLFPPLINTFLKVQRLGTQFKLPWL